MRFVSLMIAQLVVFIVKKVQNRLMQHGCMVRMEVALPLSSESYFTFLLYVFQPSLFFFYIYNKRNMIVRFLAYT